MKKIRLFCDPMLTAMAICICVFVTPMSSFCLKLFIEQRPSINDSDFFWWLFCIGGFSSIFPLIFMCAPKWFAFIELDDEGMCVNSIYKKSKKIPYENLFGFQVAYYYHYSHIRYFLVIGRKILSPWQLAHINHVSNSEDLVKIKLSKRRYKVLCEILPTEQKERLQKVLNGDLTKDGFDIEKLLKRQAAKEKKRRKRKKNKK